MEIEDLCNSYVNFSHQRVKLMSREIQTSVICGCMWKLPMLSNPLICCGLIGTALSSQPWADKKLPKTVGRWSFRPLLPMRLTPQFADSLFCFAVKSQDFWFRLPLVERMWLRTRIWLGRRRFFKDYRDTHIHKVTVCCHVQG